MPSAADQENVDRYALERYVPSVNPQVRSPSSLVRAYRSIVHVPRPVLALLALASVLALAVRMPARREVLLFSGSALLLLAGTAATAGFAQRYLLCAVPLLAIGGTLALRDVLNAARTHGEVSTSEPHTQTPVR